MNCLLKGKRFLAAMVTTAFLATNIVTPLPRAQAQGVEPLSQLVMFEIPVALGKVTNIIRHPSPDAPLVIHIQEAHANYDAQKNIRDILEHLVKNYGIRLVLLEGAGHKLNSKLLNFFPQEPALQQTANKKLMQAGELTGAETFMISDGDDQHVEAWGVEESGSYAKNRAAFKRVFEGHKLAEDFLKGFYSQWQRFATLFLSKPLKEFLIRETAFEEGRLPLTDWMSFLKKAAVRDLNLDLDEVREQKDWPILVRYFRLKTIDPKIDAAKVETEKKAFLEEIRKRDRAGEMKDSDKSSVVRHPSSVIREVEAVFESASKHDLPAYKTRFVFERLLDQIPQNFSFGAYPNLRLYLQQTILLSELQGEPLQEEIKRLTGKLTTRLIKTEKDRQFTGMLHDFRLIKKLFQLELSRGEYQAILSDKITLEKLLQELQAQDPKAKIRNKNLSPRFLRLKSLYGTAIRFYEGAIEREDRMMERTFSRMQEQKQTRAVLITGGFHTEGLKEKIFDAGSSYIEITPRIGEITADSRKHYLTALLGGKTVETSQIAAVVRSDVAFLKEVSPSWRRELAEVGASVFDNLRQVVSLDRAQKAVSDFLAAAVGVSGANSTVARAEARSEGIWDEEHYRKLFEDLQNKDLNVAAEALDALKKLPEPNVRLIQTELEEEWGAAQTKDQLALLREFRFAERGSYTRTVARNSFFGIPLFFRERADGHIFMDPMPGPKYFKLYYDPTYGASYTEKKELLSRKQESAPHFAEFIENSLNVKKKKDFFRGSKVLEIGAGMGYLLDAGRGLYGWEPEAVEIVPQFITHLRELGIKVLEKTFKDAAPKLKKNGYDLVLMKDVLEHLPDPANAIQTAGRILKPGGALFIETPQIIDQAVFSPSQHVNNFSEQSLRELLEQNGFKIIAYERSGRQVFDEYYSSGRKSETPIAHYYHDMRFVAVKKNGGSQQPAAGLPVKTPPLTTANRSEVRSIGQGPIVVPDLPGLTVGIPLDIGSERRGTAIVEVGAQRSEVRMGDYFFSILKLTAQFLLDVFMKGGTEALKRFRDNFLAMRYAAAKAMLAGYKQEAALQFWDTLVASARNFLLDQIKHANWRELSDLKETLVDHPRDHPIDFSGAQPVGLSRSDDPEDKKAGEELLSRGAAKGKAEFGIILVAGGSGDRFRVYFPDAKGLFKGTPLGDETLFETMIKKNHALAKRYGHSKIYPFIIMTSDVTHEQTVDYFESKNWFGMKDRILIVRQRNLPVIRQSDGKVLMKEKGEIALQGTGHGDAFDDVLLQSPVRKWLQRFGVHTMMYMNIDNPLYPLDVNWIGAHARFVEKVKTGTLKFPEGFAIMSEGLIRKKDRERDKLSELLVVNGVRMPVHYTKAPQALRAQTSHGTPSFRIIELPLDGTRAITFSKMNKTAKGFDEHGVMQERVPIWKFERNSDDKMSDGANFPFENEDTFASIKEPPTAAAETPETSKRLQSNHWRTRLEAAGYQVDDSVIVQLPWETDYMSREELRAKLKSAGFPDHLSALPEGPVAGGYYVLDDWSWEARAVTAARSEARELTEEELAKLQPKYPSAAAFFDHYRSWREQNPDKILLTLGRHVESTSNLLGYNQSNLTFSPPTLRGQRQGERLTRFFTSRKIPFTRVISSALDRAFFTVDGIARALALPHETLKRLNELSGHPLGGIPRNISAELYAKFIQYMNQDPEQYELPSFSGKSQLKYLRELFAGIQSSADKDILIGTHGLTLRWIIEILLKIPPTKDREVMEKIGGSPNVGITVFAYDPQKDQWELQVLYDNTYLPDSLKRERTGFEVGVERIYFIAKAIQRIMLRFLGFAGPVEISDYQPFLVPFLAPTEAQRKVILSIYRRTFHMMAERYVAKKAGEDETARSEVRTNEEMAASAYQLYQANQTGYVDAGNGKFLKSPGMEDSLVLLVKPSIGNITEKTIAEVLRTAESRGYFANGIHVVSPVDIREQNVMEKHYPRHAEVAFQGWKALDREEKNAVRDFLRTAGFSHRFAGETAPAFSAMGLMEKTGLSAEELAKLWAASFREGRVKKLGAGSRAFRIGLVTLPEEKRVPEQYRGITVPVLNGFLPALVEDFSRAAHPTIAIWLKKDLSAEGAATFQQMRDEFAGETDPREAAQKHPDSLRARAFRNDPKLELSGSEMDVRKNFIHLTAPEDRAIWAREDGAYVEGEFHAWFKELVGRGPAIPTGQPLGSVPGAPFARSEIRQAAGEQGPAESVKEPSWVETHTPRLARHHVYSRQWECGLPMDLLERIEKLYGSYVAGEISQVTLTGGLGALMPDLFEAWTAIGMNVTGIHPLWNFIKNVPLKGVDRRGVRELFAKIAKEQMEDTGIKFDVPLNVLGNPKTISFRVYKTKSMVHGAPQYYLDAYTTRADGQEEPAFLEVYDDTGKREIDMAFFSDASERLIRILEKDPNPGNVVLIDHEVFVSLPIRYLKKAKRMTLNHTVFRPGLFEAWEGFFELLNFPEWLRSTIVHDGKISIADYTAEVFDCITGVNLVEHLPALLKNIFRTAWFRVKGFYDPENKTRSTNGVFLPRWQSPERRSLIERCKKELEIPRPGNQLPPEANDRQFFEELDKHPALRERFKGQNEWVGAQDAAELLIWLRQKRDFKGASDWLGNTFKNYQAEHQLDDVQLMTHLRGMQELLGRAVRENRTEDWEALETNYGKARDLLLGDPVASNVRRQVPYKGPDKYEEGLKVAGASAVEEAAQNMKASMMTAAEAEATLRQKAEEAVAQAGLKVEFTGPYARAFDQLFLFWKAYKEGRDQNYDRYRNDFEGLRARLKGQATIEELRNSLCRLMIGGRTFDDTAHDRFLYIRFMTELLGLEDRIATLEDYTYSEAQIIFRGTQAGVMLSDEDLEASATSMMKVKVNGGEVVGPYAGSNPEIWVIWDKKSGKVIEVLDDKGEPNTRVITQDILREKLRKGEWEILDGVFVAYDDNEKSAQEGGGRRPSTRSLFDALRKVKELRSNPEVRRERMYRAVSNAWKVDMVTGQAMAHASLIENMLREIEERDAMFAQLKFETSDYAVPMKAADFGWKTRHFFEKHSAKGLGLFGLFRSFRDLKTWQNRGPATRGLQALNSLKHHAYYGDIFKYLRENVLDHLSPGLQPFKEKIEHLAAMAETADDKGLLVLNLQAMDLTEMLLVRMAGDWFERYMQAGPAEAESLRKELTQGVGADYQPWASYIARYLEDHPDARVLRTRDNKIQSFIFTPADRPPVLINLNVGAPVKFEEDANFRGLKARTQVMIDDSTFRQLTANASKAKFIQFREPKFGYDYAVHPKEELVSEIGVGIPMPSGIEVIEWNPVKLRQLTALLADVGNGKQKPLAGESLQELIRETGVDHELELVAILKRIGNKQKPLTMDSLKLAMDSLKRLIREGRAGYEPSEGRVSSDQLSEQLEVLAGFDQENARKNFGENLRPLMVMIGLFRPDLLKSSQIFSWDQAFYEKMILPLEEIQGVFGDDLENVKQHNYYVMDANHHGSLVLARKDPKRGDVFIISFQLAADSLEAAEDGKVSTKVDNKDLIQVLDQGARYLVRDRLARDEKAGNLLDYGEREDLLQGWTLRVPFRGGDHVQILRLEKKSSEARSEVRTLGGTPAARSEVREEQRWPQHEAQKIAVIGAGFVGATKAILLVTDWGHDVVAVDVQPQIVEKLSHGKLTFHADDLQELLSEGLGTGKLKFTTDYREAIEGREIIFLAVQTPQSETGHANIGYLKDSVREIAKLIHPGESKIIIGKSTAPPRDTVAALKTVVAEEFQLREAAGEDLQGAAIHFAWEPEFLREGKEVEDDRGVAGRVVIGADDPAIAIKIKNLYAFANPDPKHARTNVPIVLTDLTSAPLVKYAANGYRSVKISYINFISWLTEALGLNIDQVAHDIATQKDSQEEDRRIGRAFLSAGLGFGGSCFPKDLAAAVQIARGNGVLPGLLLDALAVNELQWRRFVEKSVISQLRNVQGKTIVVLGASFKAGTDDIREARAVKIISKLLGRGAKIRVYDPVAVERLRDRRIGPFKDDTAIEYYSEPSQLNAMLENADAVILATEWSDFNGIDFNNLRNWFVDHKKKLPPIFDGRNFFNQRKVNDPEMIRQLQHNSPGLDEESLTFPYFNIGHGETSGTPLVPHAEFVERVRESFLALRISYINMIAELSERVGANIRDVKRGLGLDFVVGEEYLAPGIGWGGNKLSTALEALEGYVAQYLPEQLLQEFQKIRQEIQQKFEFSAEAVHKEARSVPFITTVKQINDQQIALYLEKAKKAAGGDLRGRVVAVLGLAYKPGEFATYESRALNLIEALLEEGAIVRATDVDQQAVTNARRDLDEMHVPHPENLTLVLGAKTARENAREAIRGSEIQFLVTASSAFANVDSIFFDENGRAVARHSKVVDGRHFYAPADLEKHGIEYFAVGIPSRAVATGVENPKQTKTEAPSLVLFPEKAVRIYSENPGRILLKLRVKMKPEMLGKVRIFAHFGFYERKEIPWQDQEVNAQENIVFLGQTGDWGEYEISAEVDPGKSFPGKAGMLGATFFVLPGSNTAQEARFFSRRLYAGDQSVQDGKFEVETARSEIRATTDTAIPATMDELIRANVLLGGGQLQGFRGVTQKVTDGIYSLMVPALKASQVAVSFFFPEAQAQEAFDITSVPATAHEQKRFADARKVLLGGKILGATDGLILTSEFGVDLGAALLMRKIAGDAPVAVLIRNEADRGFLDKINARLRQANRPLIFPAATLNEAVQFLGRSARGTMNIKPMVYSGEKNMLQADRLLREYGKAVITITPRMYKNFLNLAGVSEVITRLRDEYLATARSA